MTLCLLWHQGYVCLLNSKILKSYYKYSYSLPAARPMVYTQSCAPSPPLHILCFIFGFPPLRICCQLITLSHFPRRCYVCLDCRQPLLPRCPLAGSSCRRAWPITSHLLSFSAVTTHSRVQLTQMSHTFSVYVKAISTEVPVIHPAIWIYKGHS